MSEKLPLKPPVDAQEGEKRTDVLNTNVSRETILAGTDYKALYALFRSEGMPWAESLYNAIYIGSHNKYYDSEIAPQEKFESLHEHPQYLVVDYNCVGWLCKNSFCTKVCL